MNKIDEVHYTGTRGRNFVLKKIWLLFLYIFDKLFLFVFYINEKHKSNSKDETFYCAALEPLVLEKFYHKCHI